MKKTARLAAGGDSALETQAVTAGLEIVGRYFASGNSVPTRIATAFQRRIRAICDSTDPFEEEKDREYLAGRRAVTSLSIPTDDDVEGLLRLSALGNRIDFFRDPAEVETEWAGGTLDFAEYDGPDLEHALGRASTVLFLSDNAAEAPFDLPLLGALQSQGLQIHVAVKGGPSQNDLTRADVARLGVSLPGLIDTGSDAVGCELSLASHAFRRAWRAADLILAKGMANFETLSEYPRDIERKQVFFILCAKCKPVADRLGVKAGEAVVRASHRLDVSVRDRGETW